MPMHLRRRWREQPSGLVTPKWDTGVAAVYLPQQGRETVLSPAGRTDFSQASVGSAGSGRDGGITYSGTQAEASGGPRISGFPCAFVAYFDVLLNSGNLSASALLGLGETTRTTPVTIGLISSYVGDTRPSYRAGNVFVEGASSVHGKTVCIAGISRSASQHELWMDGALIASSTSSATAFQGGAARLELFAAREYNFGAWRYSANVALRLGAWFDSAIDSELAREITLRPFDVLLRRRASRMHFSSGGTLTLTGLTMSNFTSSGARATLGITR